MGHTPSPLTNAMNDVMNCFEDMGIAREPSPQPVREPPSVWSPEAFDEIYSTARKAPGRPHTAFEMSSKQVSDYGVEVSEDRSTGPPQLDDYVQRMESRLRQLHEQEGSQPGTSPQREPPTPPPKNVGYQARPQSSLSIRSHKGSKRGLRQMKSTYELGKGALNRTFTLKSNATTSSSSTSMTNNTLMSGTSAGGFSATSAGSYYRKKVANGQQRPMSTMDYREANGMKFGMSRPQTPLTGISYHSSHDSVPDTPGTEQAPEWMRQAGESPSVLGGLATPKAKKSGFFKKMIESAKTGAANARSTISSSGMSSRPGSAFGGSRSESPTKQSMLPSGVTSIAGGMSAPPRPQSAAARDMGLGGANDWVQVRRDVNRSNSLSKNERIERADRCQMLDIPVICPIDELTECAEGDEGLDGLPVTEPTDFNACALALVDKSARFVNNLPPTTNAAGLVQGYLCRPYRSDVQRLRAIFTWAAERISWEEDFELGEHVDTRRLIQTKRGCSQEIAVLVAEMCAAVGIHAEVVQGYLKTPGEVLDFDMANRPNHWWNAVIADGEWRIMDCSLASPTNVKRKLYSMAGVSAADGFWFLTRPMEICYTHVPLIPEQQHIVPPIAPEVLLALPCACPPYFRNGLRMVDFDTSSLHLENLELSHIHIAVPEDVECVAEVEVRAFAQDADGDFFESGDVVRKPVLSQAEWIGGGKRFTIKSLLPGDEGQGVLKVYTGKRGLMVSQISIPYRPKKMQS
jgi:roadblock/LC7 domain-containing protein